MYIQMFKKLYNDVCDWMESEPAWVSVSIFLILFSSAVVIMVSTLAILSYLAIPFYIYALLPVGYVVWLIYRFMKYRRSNTDV